MELKQIIKTLNKHKKIFFSSVLYVLLVSILIYYSLPDTYYTSGSIYVTRETDSNSEQFTYEGYYAQQTAQNYTNNIIAILESMENKRQVLETYGEPATEKSLKKLDRMTKVVKASPQIINVSVKDILEKKSEELWKITVEKALSTAGELTSSGDNKIKTGVLEGPVVKKSEKPLPLFIAAGITAGIIFGTIMSALREYFKEEK